MQSKRRVAAAVVEFNSLPDAVWSAAQDHDLGLGLWVGLIFLFVSRIHIRREGLELSCARVHALEHGCYVPTRALQPHGRRRGLPDLRKLLIARAMPLDFAEQVARGGLYGNSGGALVDGHDFLELMDEPGLDLRQVTNLFRGQAAFQGHKQPVNPVWPRRSKLFA